MTDSKEKEFSDDIQFINNEESIRQNKLYDAACRKLLSNKTMLAQILAECADEFKGIDRDEIAEKYIEPELSIGSVPVMPDEKMKSIHGMKNEDKTENEGTIVYDIRFRALVPGTKDEKVELIVNVEAQNSFYPGYPLIKRGIYYGARLLSSQYGEEFVNIDYKKLKKVYSIWICTDTPKKRQNTITEYYIKEHNRVGSVKEKAEDYDLIRVIMVCLGEDSEKYGGLLEILGSLLNPSIDTEKKKEVLEKYNIKLTPEITEEVSNMCNLSEGVYRRGVQQGIQTGILQGRQEGIQTGILQGRQEGIALSIQAMVEAMNISPYKAMDILNIPEEERSRYEKAIKS